MNKKNMPQIRKTLRSLSPLLWWVFFLSTGLFLQIQTGGLDVLSPGVLICLQCRKTFSAVWLTLCLVFLQEGLGDFVFGPALAFYSGMFFLFFLCRWFLDPFSPFFLLLFSLLLSLWLVAVVSSAVIFQELPVVFAPLWQRILVQWFVYVLLWGVGLWGFRRWVCRARS